MAKFVQYKNHQKALARYRMTQVLTELYIPHDCDNVQSDCTSTSFATSHIIINNKKIELLLTGNSINSIDTGVDNETIYPEYKNGEYIYKTHTNLELDKKEMKNLILGNLTVKRFPEYFEDLEESRTVSSRELIEIRFKAKMKLLRAFDDAEFETHSSKSLVLIHTSNDHKTISTTSFSIFYDSVFDWNIHTESLNVLGSKWYHLQFKYINYIANDNVEVKVRYKY